MVEREALSSLPIWPQVEGPFLSRNRIILLRVRFIKMLDMWTTTRGMVKGCCRRVYSCRLLRLRSCWKDQSASMNPHLVDAVDCRARTTQAILGRKGVVAPDRALGPASDRGVGSADG